MSRGPYKHYMLGVLLFILAFNYVDRLALGLLLQDIKTDLALSDTQLGLLTGIGFALFYSLMGIPLARWADRGNRVLIIAVTTFLWSVAVASLAGARSFFQFLLIRVGVAVGEAGCLPPAHSLIADYFNRAERPRAVAIYMLGVPLGMVIGYFPAGWLNEIYGWRVTFMLLGVPGVCLSIVAWLTLREPRGDATYAPNTATSIASLDRKSVNAFSVAQQPSMREACVVLWANRSFRHLLFCMSVAFFFGYGILQWKPAFFIRSFGLSTGEVGTWLAVIHGLGGGAGVYLGGALASRYAAHNERLQLKATALAYSSFAVLSACVYLSPNHYLAFGLLTVSTIGVYTINGPLFATIQTLVPAQMRAVSIAIVYLFANLVGMGLGPLAAGALSDWFAPSAGVESLRYALLALCPGYFWCAWHTWRASQSVDRDVRMAMCGATIRADALEREANASNNVRDTPARSAG